MASSIINSLRMTGEGAAMANPLTMSELEEALQIAAKVVAIHGETYLPHFEVLEQEYLIRQRRGSALERARLMAARTAAPASLPQTQYLSR